MYLKNKSFSLLSFLLIAFSTGLKPKEVTNDQEKWRRIAKYLVCKDEVISYAKSYGTKWGAVILALSTSSLTILVYKAFLIKNLFKDAVLPRQPNDQNSILSNIPPSIAIAAIPFSIFSVIGAIAGRYGAGKTASKSIDKIKTNRIKKLFFRTERWLEKNTPEEVKTLIIKYKETADVRPIEDQDFILISNKIEKLWEENSQNEDNLAELTEKEIDELRKDIWTVFRNALFIGSNNNGNGFKLTFL
ncbi:hypothetical protein ACFLY6_00110 [Candidatus Dependentiae bacterium]